MLFPTDLLAGIEAVEGSLFADNITGDGNDNLLSGLAGGDHLYGNGGSDTLTGGAGADSFYDGLVTVNIGQPPDLGSATGEPDPPPEPTLVLVTDFNPAEDRLVLPEGAAFTITDNGTDTIVDWTFEDRAGSFTLAGVTGTSPPTVEFFPVFRPDASGEIGISVTGDATDETLIGGVDRDTLDGAGGNDRIEGNEASDRLIGGAGDDTLLGGAGDDTLLPGSGLDDIYGGSGWDVLDYSAFAVGEMAHVNFQRGTDFVPDFVDPELPPPDRALNVESVIGGAGDDLIVGTSYGENLAGGGGNDTLRGRGGTTSCSGARAPI